MDGHRKEALRSREQSVRPIVGIGGSARELAEVQRFLLTVVPDCGVAYILVLHIDPADMSGIASMLTGWCPLPIVCVQAGSAPDCACEPDHIYIVSSDSLPTLEAGHLRLWRSGEVHAPRAPIDRFFVSLAEDQEDNAAGVILSGAGGEGAVGVRAIKLHGGIVLAQSDVEAGGPMRGLPAAALADLAMPVDEIVPRLRAHFNHRAGLALDALAEIRADAGSRSADFCDILRVRTGHDFSGFKRTTLTRQVQRRMHLLRISDADAFVSLLKAEPAEADRLFDDLLIGLTEFFHDKEAFDALARDVVPAIAASKGRGEAVRVWVPGCATGEEAYAIAMLLCEQAEDGAGRQIQVFASDIDGRSLASARRGRYPASIAEFVGEERLRRFFVREDQTYRVTASLRDTCLFTNHDLLRDPPFSRIDLIVCRNVLIHFDPELQKRIVKLLHYAMCEGGYLFMGESENVTDGALFETIDPANRIFRKRHGKRIRPPRFPMAARAPVEHQGARQSEIGKGSLVARAERQMLEHFGPAHVVTDSLGEIIYASGRTGAYLEMQAGAPDSNIFSLARPALRQKLRAAFHEATARNQTVIVRRIAVGSVFGGATIDLIVQPVDGTDAPDPAYLVAFREVGDVPLDSLIEAEERSAIESASIRQLELELRRSQESLQTTTEELESSNEELRSANEELSSLNEELQTVNAELSVRVDELSSAMNDVANLLESTQIATIFLDRDLRLRFFTPAARDLYHLAGDDLGRLITDLRPRFKDDSLLAEAPAVLRTLIPRQRLVRIAGNDDAYMMRMLPYRTSGNAIEGIVLTFVEQRRFNSL